MNQFARDVSILQGHPSYQDVVASEFCHLWKGGRDGLDWRYDFIPD